jgi:hypothetical protein
LSKKTSKYLWNHYIGPEADTLSLSVTLA